MIRNRKSSKLEKGFSRFLARLWRARFALVLAAAYGGMFLWLFLGSGEGAQARPVDLPVIPGEPRWEAPGGSHWFGTTAKGLDLFTLSRAAMARTGAFAVVVTLSGSLIALLIALPFVFEGGERGGLHSPGRFTLLRAGSDTASLVPAFVALCIILGGSGGGVVVTVLTFSVVVGVRGSSRVADWFEEEDQRPDRVAGKVLGMPLPSLVKSRSLPVVLRGLLGMSARWLPAIMLAEMALGFLGFTGGSLSCGVLIAAGKGALLEAPWVIIHPGLFAGVVVLVFSLLGELTHRLLRGKEAGECL